MSYEIRVAGGRVLKTTPVFDTYWRFISERQAIFMRRVVGDAPPWTEDPILQGYRFTNVYRASDRVSQYLIRHVLYEGSQSREEVFFRAILFRIFNRIETWEALQARLGVVSWQRFSFEAYAEILDRLHGSGERLYSAAYIMPSPAFGSPRKHRNHIRLIEYMMADGAPLRLVKAASLRAAFEVLRSYPSLGAFLAFQFAIDLNYSGLIDFSEMDFVAAGPGARDGIRKCFYDTAGLTDAQVVQVMSERAAHEFSRLGIRFQKLWGRDLQLVDLQNVFCEVSKYARVAHPEIESASGRTRIKQRFKPLLVRMSQWYPPKWGLAVAQETTAEG